MESFEPFMVDHLGPGVIRERAVNGKLVIFAIDNGHDDTIATWAEAVRETLTNWKEKTPCMMMHDLVKSGQLAFDAHMEADFKEIYEMRQDLERYVAFILPQDVIDTVRLDIETFQLEHYRNYTFHWAVFPDRRSALDWLIDKTS